MPGLAAAHPAPTPNRAARIRDRPAKTTQAPETAAEGRPVHRNSPPRRPARRGNGASGQPRGAAPPSRPAPDAAETPRPAEAASPPEPTAPPAPELAGTAEEDSRVTDAGAVLRKQARILREQFFPGQLVAALELDGSIHPLAARLQLVQIRHEAGATGDPIAEALVDQLTLAHLVVSRLHALAAQATQLEFKRLYLHHAIQLHGEWRKLALALREYRDRPRRARRKAGPSAPRRAKTRPASTRGG